MKIIQVLSCAMFGELDKGKQVTYEGMCTGDVHEYERILNSNECRPYKKVKTSDEDASLPQAYMAIIDSLFDKKSQALKASTKSGNRGDGGHQSLHADLSETLVTRIMAERSDLSITMTSTPHTLKSLYKSMHND